MLYSTSMATGSRLGAIAVAAVVLSFVGCASTQLDAQWTDPQFAGTSLRGAKVLVACESSDLAIKRICQDQLASEITAHGATPVIASEPAGTTPGGRPAVPGQYVPAARDAGAKAILSAAVAPDAFAAYPGGSSVGFGIGGFGGGHRSGGGIGVGIAVPMGGAQSSMAYAANSTLTDVATGRPMWTAKASTPASSDLSGQLAALAKAVVEGVQKAGLL
jgi:hypothetical protein